MAFASDIIIGTATFSASTIKSNSTVRGNPASDLDNPDNLTISHETASSGRVSSVVILDEGYVIPCNDTCGTAPALDKTRVLFKIQYDPATGPADLKIALTAQIAAMVAFVSDAANVIKLLNKEH